jgi:hypothetical protein
VAGEFASGPSDFRAGAGVAAHHAQHPQAWHHDEREQEQGGRDREHHSSHRDVVDQPSLAEARGDKKAERAVLARLGAGERLGVARFEIIESESRFLELDGAFAHTLAIGSPAAIRAAHALSTR